MTDTPRGAPELVESQAVPETTVNQQVRHTEAGASHFLVADDDLTAPPGSCADGASYIIAGSPTGAWTGKAGWIATALGANAASGWTFHAPQEGYTAYVQDENVRKLCDGAAWALDTSGGGGPVTTSGLTMATARLLGRTTASTGAIEELTVGAGLALSGTSLIVDQAGIKQTESLMIACSDETTAITTGTGKATFRMPYAFNLTAVRASVTTAPTGSTIIIDINVGGSTILSTKLSIDASEKTSTTAASAAVMSGTNVADDAEITIDFDQVGSTIAGAGVKVTLIGNRT